MLTAHYFNQNGEHLVKIVNIQEKDANFFKKNGIKVSIEKLNDEFVLYGCPYKDQSEESEVIVFAKSLNGFEPFQELALECSKNFKLA